MPPSTPAETAAATESPPKAPTWKGTYRPWAELLKRTFGIDVLQCPKCAGLMKLVAMITDPNNAARYLRGIGELPSVPERSPRWAWGEVLRCGLSMPSRRPHKAANWG